MTGFEPAIVFIVIGLGLMLAIRTPLDRLHGALLPGLGFLAGLYAATLILMSAAIVTKQFYMPLFWTMGFGSVGIVIWRRGDAMRRIALMRGSFRGITPAAWVFIATLAAASIYNIWLVVVMAYSFPVVGYDAIGNYMMKAALWFDTRQLFPEKLMDPEFVMYHRRYPPALPVAEMIWFSILGGIDLIRVKGLFLTCWGLQSAALYALLRRRNGAAVAWLGTAFWIMLPYHLTEYQGGAIDGYPDVPLIFGLLGALALVREFGHEKAVAPAALMAFVVAGCVLIKPEGVIFAFFLTLYLLIRRAPLRNIALIGIFTIVNIAIWKLAGRGVPSHLDESYFSLNTRPGEILSRLGALFEYAKAVFSDEMQWGLCFAFLGFAWAYKLLRVPWRLWGSMELGLGAAILAVYTGVLVNTPLGFDLHLESATDRLFLHTLPLFIIATFDNFENGRPLKDSWIVTKLASFRNS